MLLGCDSNENLSDELSKDSVGQVLLLQVDYTIHPGKGFHPIIVPDIYNFEEQDYLEVWSKVQHLKLTREYIKANPNQKVNL